jgi:hypothetical protein
MRSLLPLSRDHLLPLVEFNVFRATTTNIFILGHGHLLRGCSFHSAIPIFPPPDDNDMPVSLRPTALQLSKPHEDWIDILPCPRMRDNTLRTRHLFNNNELGADIFGRLMGVESSTTDAGLLVWSNPWEPGGWELSEGFVRKWGFLVEGCDEMFAATDRWRALRGEDPLVVK